MMTSQETTTTSNVTTTSSTTHVTGHVMLGAANVAVALLLGYIN